MPGITQPFNFRQHLRSRPKAGFDPVPFLDALCIALFLGLHFSYFILTPGASIELPKTRTHALVPASGTAVLTVDRNRLYFFEGAKLSEEGLRKALVAFVETESVQGRQASLLVKADVGLQSEVLFRLMDFATEAGFARIHLAADLGPQAADPPVQP
jgi:biopolymer transport protein ExbD